MAKLTVSVLGAGMVGVCSALELQQRGYAVTLYDRSPPGRETSYGNAGVLARSSLMPFNHPGLWAALPKLLKNTSTQFRYDRTFLLKNLPWAFGFLSRARHSVFNETTTALDHLIRLSGPIHRNLLADAGVAHRLRETGWIFLYRNEAGFLSSRLARDAFERYAVATEVLDADGLAGLEPDLKPIFPRALWIKDAASVDSPGEVVQAYARLFVARGGRIEQRAIRAMQRTAAAQAWQLTDEAGERHVADRVVVALGPWSPAFLKSTLGIGVPMAFERGYHMHYGSKQGATLSRPVYDTSGGYVLSPMAQGLRLTTGVQLTAQDAPPDLVQLDLAEQSARQAFPLDQRIDPQAWLGSRPTLPDSRPMIGACPRHPGVWLAFGHQHIGFSTGPGSAALLGALMDGEPGKIDPNPFRPARFLR